MKLSLLTLGLLALLPATTARLGGSARTLKTNLIEKKPRFLIAKKFSHNSPLIPDYRQDNNEKKVDNGAQQRIVGGEPASPGEFPFFVDFGYCGASLIYEDIVVSAAHCASEVEFTNEVYVGAFIEQYTGEAVARQNGNFDVRNIVTSRVHPAYDDFTLQNDIMVIKIDSPSRHAPVAINRDSNSPVGGDNLTAIGHGVNDTSNPFQGTKELHKVTIPFVPQDDCTADFAALDDDTIPELDIVEDVMLCAGLDEGGKDSCQGDSGGPLLKRVGDGYEQVGITSFGFGCGLPNSPGVYTRISFFKDWLDEQICVLSANPPPGCTPPSGGCHLANISEEDCPPSQVTVQAVPPNGETSAFDWEAGSTTLYYSRLEQSSAMCKDHVYQNQNGLRYNLTAAQELECPDSIILEATGADIVDWDQTSSGLMTFANSGSTDGKFYCSYEAQNFTVQLSRCQRSRLEGQTTVLVEVTYDDYPYETGWSISQDDVVLASRDEGTVNQSGFMTERIYLFPGEYTFRMTDAVGDGTCCTFGNGSWRLSAELEGNDPLLAEGDGLFSFETSATFAVPVTAESDPASTPAPGTTPSPDSTSSFSEGTPVATKSSCKDSEMGTFTVDGDVGTQTCAWLIEDQDRLENCRFTDVALTCPETCDICDLLNL